MKKIILILVLFLFSTALADVFDHPVTLDNISSQMPKMGSIKCKFRQEKTMQNVKKPLISGGDFEFIEGKGVYFYTKYPIQSTSDYTSEKYKQINGVVKAISAKKYSKIEKEFSFYFEKNSNNWALGMKPKSNSDAYNYISSITLEGADFIRKMTINQPNGSKTTLWFTK